MYFDWSTFALQTVNFAVLVWLLHRFLYQPILRLVDTRRAAIETQYAAAHTAEEAAETRLAATEKERAGIATERAAVLKEATIQVEEQASARRAAAERDAAELIEEARKAVTEERELLLAEAQRQAFDLAANIARRLFAELPAKLRAEAWMERIESYLDALPGPERDTLARQLGRSSPLRVVTAAALSDESTENWRARLRRSFGDGIAVEYDVDPELVAGAELHFPNASLRFSYQSALEAIRLRIDADADAY